MGDVNKTVDPSDPQYQNLLTALGNMRTFIAPLIPLLNQLPRDKQNQWLKRDPLMRRIILFSRKVTENVDLELNE